MGTSANIQFLLYPSCRSNDLSRFFSIKGLRKVVRDKNASTSNLGGCMNNNDVPTPSSDPAGLSRWFQSSHNDPETPKAQTHHSSSRMLRLKKPTANKSLITTPMNRIIPTNTGVNTSTPTHLKLLKEVPDDIKCNLTCGFFTYTLI